MPDLHGHEDHPHGNGVHGYRVHGTGGAVVRLAKNLSSEVAGRVLSLVTSALGLVAALAWNEAVLAFFKEYAPSGTESMRAKFLYAVIVSLIVIVITVNLSKLASFAKTEPPKQ